MANIHDSGYKRLFSNPTIFRQLMESFVDQPWVADLDFSRAESLDKSFVSEHYKTTESDLIYRLPYGDGELYIYVLLEFQSTVDPWMALRVLNYVTNFYMDYVESGKGTGKLPPVFPIVLYNGDRRWTAATEIADLIRSQPSLEAYALRFQYFKIAENEYTREQLLSIRNIVSTLFLAEGHYSVEDLVQETLALFDREEDRRAFSLFINWFRQLATHDVMDEEDYRELEREYRSKEEVTAMLIKSLERERQRFREQGREEGREEVLAGIVRTMHERGFDLSTIVDVTGLEPDAVQKLLDVGNDPSAINESSSA